MAERIAVPMGTAKSGETSARTLPGEIYSNISRTAGDVGGTANQKDPVDHFRFEVLGLQGIITISFSIPICLPELVLYP